MTTSIPTPPAPASKGPATNRRDLSQKDYGGRPSTLCSGCGHDAITSALTRALWEEAVNPFKVAKMSGIGCSSKTTAYFLSKSWGFNSVHGRMPSVTTGAMLANSTLRAVGVSGDGDTSAIGMGQFVHVIRRNLPMVYVVENNGVYGLTKGQFSATSDRGATSKYAGENPYEAIDLCGLALELGCSFVARSFSADRKQLIPILRAALNHHGTAIVDVISPCVTFNNHASSTKSYDWGRAHEERIHEVGYVAPWDPPDVDYEEGSTIDVPMPDGGHIMLSKLDRDYDPRDRNQARRILADAFDNGLFVTGIFYVNPEEPSLMDTLNVVDEPLGQLGQADLRPDRATFDEILASFG